MRYYWTPIIRNITNWNVCYIPICAHTYIKRSPLNTNRLQIGFIKKKITLLLRALLLIHTIFALVLLVFVPPAFFSCSLVCFLERGSRFLGSSSSLAPLPRAQIRTVFLMWLPWILRMGRPGRKITRKSILISNRMKELELKERSSKSLLANVLDIEDDFRHQGINSSQTAIGSK